MIKWSVATRVLVGRLLTRSGDQAWDFAVPIVLLQILPNKLNVAALYFLIMKLATVLFLPSLSKTIDRVDRYFAAKLGTALQLIGVVGGLIAILIISQLNSTEFNSLPFLFTFLFLSLSGILSHLGSTFMDIAIANDLVPAFFEGEQLPLINSRIRQIDLFTEVASPVLAGTLLLISHSYIPLSGFVLVALWNIISFIPEILLLKSLFAERPDLKNKMALAGKLTKESFWSQLQGWRAFFKEPIAPAVVAYALLWLSVMSPHGVLLTAYLKDGWKMPELTIGVFRGSGAIFGLLATVLFPLFIKKMNVLKASFIFLFFQAAMLLLSLVCFSNDHELGQYGFLFFILLSRIGLYGFSLGEMQIRQTQIAPHVRGEINGFANALTAVATIGLFGAGVLLPTTDDFKYLIFSSVFFVALALMTYTLWYRKQITLGPENAKS